MNKKLMFRFLALALMICMLVPAFSAFTFSAESPVSAQIVNAITGETVNLRAASLLKVKTTGFSSDATLEYTYSTTIPCNGYYGPIALFKSANMYTAGTYYCLGSYYNNDSTKSTVTKPWPYFAIVDRERSAKDIAGSVSVTVKDTNKKSSTYNLTATTDYSGFLPSDLQKDIENNAFGMFVGDVFSAKKMLGLAGITHITCSNTNIDSVGVPASSVNFYLNNNIISVSGTKSSATIKGLNPGCSAIALDMDKTGSCAFHPGKEANCQVMVQVFKKPAVIAATTKSLTLNNLDDKCEYFITLTGGQTIQAVRDGKGNATFTGLDPDTTYDISVVGTYQDKNGKDVHATAYTEGKTLVGYKVTVTLRLDNSNSDAATLFGTGATVALKETVSGVSFPMTKGSGASGYTNEEIAAGTYDLCVNTDKIGSITVKNSAVNKTYDYYTITFDPNGGAFEDLSNQKIVTYVAKNTNTALPSDTMTKKDHIFLGWEKVGAEGTVIAAGTALNNITAAATYKAVLELDVVGPNGPDQVPDKYQKKITYQVVNGTWQSTSDNEDIVDYVTLKTGGQWSTTGTATLSAPTGVADYGYEGGTWSPDVTGTVSGTSDATYILTYTYKGDKGVTFNKPNEDGSLPNTPATDDYTYGSVVKFDPKLDGKYEIITLKLEDAETVNDPERKDYIFMGWQKGPGDETAVAIYTALWEKDVVGDNGPDGIPDKYQKKVTLRIVNGLWAEDGNDTDIVTYVTLKTAGKWDVNGTATVTAPTEMVPNYGFENGSWSSDISLPLSGVDPVSFTYSYNRIPDQEVKYNRENEDGSYPPVETTEKLPYGSILMIDPNGGDLDGSEDPKYVPLEGPIVVNDPTNPGFLFMGWEQLPGSLEQECDYIYRAVWEKDVISEDGKGDHIPDKYQKVVTLRVVNGTWDDKSAENRYQILTLVNEQGKWDVNGTAKLVVPTGMIALEGFEGGAFDTDVNAVLTGTDALTVSYIFVETPPTGDSDNITPWAVLSVISLAMTAAFVFAGKKKYEA